MTQLTEIEKYLRADRHTLLSAVLPPPDKSGGMSWLWLPRPGCPMDVCLVSHIDTVHPPPRKIYHDPRAGVFWAPNGLGADDRAGVWACMELRRHTGCMVLLTDGEESGGRGAREATALFHAELSAVKFFIEIDRRGRGEMVFYNRECADFRSFIGGYGFCEHAGSFSDISILSPALGIVGVNLSAGYCNEHAAAEYLVEKHLLETVAKTKKIITEEKYYGKTWCFDPAPVYPKFGGYYDTGDIPVYYGGRRKSAPMAGGGRIYQHYRLPGDV